MSDITETPKRDRCWRAKPASIQAWAALDIKGNIMALSVRDTIEDVKLVCGDDCIPIKVIVSFVE